MEKQVCIFYACYVMDTDTHTQGISYTIIAMILEAFPLPQTVLHIGALVASLLLFYIFGGLYTASCPACLGAPSQYGELEHALASPVHWLTVLLTSVLAVLPRLV